MTLISDRYDVYPVMDHPARATLDLFIVSICNDLAGKFDFLGKSSSFFRVIEPRDRRRHAGGRREELWRSHLACCVLAPAMCPFASPPCGLANPFRAAVPWPCWGCPGSRSRSRSRRSASLRPASRYPYSLPARGTSQGGSLWQPKPLSGSGAAWGGQDTKADPTTKKARQLVLFGTSWRAAIGVERSSHLRTDPQAGSIRTTTDP